MTTRSASPWILAVLLVLTPPSLSPAAATSNRPNKPAVATIQVGSSDMLVSITGRGFGSAGPLASLRFVITPVTGSQATVTLPSTDAAVLLWDDGQIVAQLPASNVRRVLVAVLAPGVLAGYLKVVRYGYETFDTNASAPGAEVNGLVMDANLTHGFNSNRVFLNFEFHTTVAEWVPQAGASTEPPPGTVQPLPGYPVPAVPIFRSLNYNNTQHATTQSSGGDNAVVDTLGRVWLNEYGSFAVAPGSENLPNHSRLLAFNAASDQFRVYNIPGDQQVLYSMAWDPGRSLIWFAQFGGEVGCTGGTNNGTLCAVCAGGTNDGTVCSSDGQCTGGGCTRTNDALCTGGGTCGRNNRLMVFNPESSAIPHDDFAFGWTTDKTCVANLCSPLGFAKSCQSDSDCILSEQMCPPGTTVAGATDCYLEIPLPSSVRAQVIRMVVHPRDGSVWMTNYGFGTELVRYDPDTDTYLHVPLPRPPGAPNPIFGDPLPWPVELKLTPAGDVLYHTQVGNTFGFIRWSDVLNPSPKCTALVSDVPGADCDVHVNSSPPLIDGPDVSCVNPCITETVLADGFLPCTPASRDDATCPWASGKPKGALYFGWITRDERVWFDIAGRGVGYIKLQDLRRGRPRFVLLPPASLYPNGPFFCPDGHGNEVPLGNIGAIAVDESNDTVWYGEYCRRRIARYWPLD